MRGNPSGGSRRRASSSAVLLLLVLPAWAALAAEAAGPLGVTLHPKDLQLATGGTEEVVAVLVNRSEEPLESVKVSTARGRDLEVRVTDEGGRLGADESRSVTLHVCHRGETGTPGPLLVQVEWQRRKEDGRMVRGVEVTEAEVQALSPPALDEMVTPEVKTAVETIEDRRRSHLAHLLVTNDSQHDVTVRKVRVHAPYFLDVAPYVPPADGPSAPSADGPDGAGEASPAGRLPRTLSPGSTISLPYRLTAERVEPGNHMVMWETDLEWKWGGRTWTGTVVAEKSFPVAVLGESVLLDLFRWPALLFMPGALVLLTWGFLQKRTSEGGEVAAAGGGDPGSGVTPVTRDFWFLAVTLSLVLWFLYGLNLWGFSPADFMVLYGFIDIFRLWMISLVLGLVAWSAWRTGGRLRDWWRRYQQQRWPQPGDDALTVLRKVRDRGQNSLRLPKVEVPGESQNENAIEILRQGDSTWIAPRISIACHGSEEMDRLTASIEKGLEALLQALGERSSEDVRWIQEAGWVATPRKLEGPRPSSKAKSFWVECR